MRTPFPSGACCRRVPQLPESWRQVVPVFRRALGGPCQLASLDISGDDCSCRRSSFLELRRSCQRSVNRVSRDAIQRLVRQLARHVNPSRPNDGALPKAMSRLPGIQLQQSTMDLPRHTFFLWHELRPSMKLQHETQYDTTLAC